MQKVLHGLLNSQVKDIFGLHLDLISAEPFFSLLLDESATNICQRHSTKRILSQISHTLGIGQKKMKQA